MFWKSKFIFRKIKQTLYPCFNWVKTILLLNLFFKCLIHVKVSKIFRSKKQTKNRIHLCIGPGKCCRLFFSKIWIWNHKLLLLWNIKLEYMFTYRPYTCFQFVNKKRKLQIKIKTNSSSKLAHLKTD